jgi:REP element-mobilizing transposase RayT
MRKLRTLRRGVWYEVRTRINNREPLFRRSTALAIFARVLHETRRRFVFGIRGFRLEEDWLTLYLKPEDGLKLPEIMKWMKQVFAQRYNVETGRTGHIWGDRYWSRILEGEPVGKEEGGKVPGEGDLRDRPRRWRRAGRACFFLIYPFPPAPAPG